MGGTFVLLLAAGSGKRIGRSDKAFMDLGGDPMFLHSYRSAVACPDIAGIVILVPNEYLEVAEAVVEAEQQVTGTLVLPGGDSRQASVLRGLEALSRDAETVVCHDAARPFASPVLFERVIGRLHDQDSVRVDGVVPIVPSTDTVKRIRGGLVVETVPRQDLGLVQTPQAFRRAPLADAHDRARRSGVVATDDAMLLEAAGYVVAVVEGDARNFKITGPEDLVRAEQLLAREATT